MSKSPPYAFDEVAFAHMKSIIEACQQRGIKVVLDPHTTPGTKKNTTTVPNDELWSDPFFQNLLVRLWDRISSEYSDVPTVVAYDLMNEPSIPKNFDSSWKALSWNGLAAELVRHVRKHDQKKAILIESALMFDAKDERLNRVESVPHLHLPQDNNLIVSFHVYLPSQFTSQGIHDLPIGVQYPGVANGQYWDSSKLKLKLQPALDFANAHHVGVYIGEFSASRCGDPVSTDKYLTDLLNIFTGYGWGWSYLSYNGSPVWSLEEPTSLPCSVSDAGAPSRVELFTDFLGSSGGGTTTTTLPRPPPGGGSGCGSGNCR